MFKPYLYLAQAFIFVILTISCGAQMPQQNKKMANTNSASDSTNTIVLGGGCFWCTEAQYLSLPGVLKVESGYAGGNIPNPSYQEICTGTTNHAEVVRITYNSSIVSFNKILESFWLAHDPTTLNKQGADEGTQYRSIILYNTETEKNIAENYIKKLNEENAFGRPVVTEVKKLEVFYIAEDYHQNYYNQNKNKPYCMMVIQPKLEKFKKVFANTK